VPEETPGQPQPVVEEKPQEKAEVDVDKLTEKIMEKLKDKAPAQESEDYEDLDTDADSEAFEPTGEDADIDYKKKYQELHRKLTAKSAGENSLKEFPHANNRVVESLVEKGASEKAIRNAARISHNEFLRGQKDVGLTHEQIKQEVEKELAGLWGHPDSGAASGPSADLTAEDIAKMSPEERKRAAETRNYRGSHVTESIKWK